MTIQKRILSNIKKNNWEVEDWFLRALEEDKIIAPCWVREQADRIGIRVEELVWGEDRGNRRKVVEEWI